jgi:soluble lytic murein transglycosylase
MLRFVQGNHFFISSGLALCFTMCLNPAFLMAQTPRTTSQSIEEVLEEAMDQTSTQSTGTSHQATLQSITQMTAKIAPSLSLSDTLRHQLGGFRFEPQEKQAELIRDAKLYVIARKSIQNKKKENRSLTNRCGQNSESSPFCQLLAEAEAKQNQKPQSTAKSAVDKNRAQRIQEITKWIREAEFEKLLPTKEQELRDALRSVNDAKDLEKITLRVLNEPACKNPILSQILGAKTEEFLPEPQVRDTAIQLYETAASCGDTESSAKSKFRLSLLTIWKGDYKSASAYLKALSEQVNYTDYRSRAYFWQYQCALQLKNEKTSAQARQALFEKYPFSLHTLLIQKDADPKEKETNPKNLPFTYQLDSEILYRSKKNIALNRRVIAAEALIEIHEEKWAKEALEKSISEFESTEPEFRLYAGVIFHRLDLYLKKFKVLNSAFRDLPSLISKPALDLYYSQNTLQATDLNHIEVDGALLLSLIRQESAFNSQARSPAGALGLMQIMPTTARKFARIRKISELLNPKVNIRIGSKYFANLLKTYGGDAELALAAYNAGPHRVDQWVKRYPTKDRVLFLDLIPFKETREYVAAIARNYYWYVTLSALSLEHSVPEERVEIRSPHKNITKYFTSFASAL